MITTTKPDRICPTCNHSVYGRKKKRFCSLKCKNEHHKIARLQTNPIQNIRNKNTKRAYVILEGIFGIKRKRIIIHQNTLFKFGFDVNAYIKVQSKNGQIYFSILDYTYRFIGKALIEVVRKKSTKVYYKEFLDRWKLEFCDGLEIKYGVGDDSLIHFFRGIQENPKKFLTVIPFYNKAFRTILNRVSP